MSGIVGVFCRDGSEININLLKKMNDQISHRGPDGRNEWCQGSVGLGNQMLHTTRESIYENLPFQDDSGLVITTDARIDNRDELLKLLNIEKKVN